MQLEAILSYDLTKCLVRRVGARYWRLETDVEVHFETSTVGAVFPQPAKLCKPSGGVHFFKRVINMDMLAQFDDFQHR